MYLHFSGCRPPRPPPRSCPWGAQANAAVQIAGRAVPELCASSDPNLDKVPGKERAHFIARWKEAKHQDTAHTPDVSDSSS